MEPIGPGALARLLAALPVQVEQVRCYTGALVLPDYPDEPRPTTIVALAGRGGVGHGEHVGFSLAVQRGFAAQMRGQSVRSGTVAQVLAQLWPDAADPHGRAAIEAALIDLALRQGGRSLGQICCVPLAPLRLRQVTSFAARPDPGVQVRALQAVGALECKIDVDPAWSPAVLAELGAPALRQAVVILDFKERGDAELAVRLAGACPAALLEDPPAGAQGHLARDRPLLTPGDVEAAARRGEAVNLKAPRMGGPLALLDGLQRARELGVVAYLGGMFEVGPGRQQARQLAALFCPDAPNDLAPIAGALGAPPGPPGSVSPGSPAVVRLDLPGFGPGDLDWGAEAGRRLARQQGRDPAFE